MKKTIVLVIFLLITSFNCVPNDIPPLSSIETLTPMVGNLEGRVWDYQGFGVPNATILANSNTFCRSESSGDYLLTNVYGPLDITFLLEKHVAYTIAGLDQSQWDFRFWSNQFYGGVGTYGHENINVNLNFTIDNTNGVWFGVYSTRSGLHFYHVPYGTNFFSIDVTNVSLGPCAVYIYDEDQPYSVPYKYFGLSQGNEIKKDLTTTINCNVYVIGSTDSGSEIMSVPIHIITPITSTSYFRGYGGLPEGRILMGKEITLMPNEQYFSYNMIKLPTISEVGFGYSCYTSYGWKNAWKDSIEVGASTSYEITFTQTIPEIPTPTVTYENGLPIFSWEFQEDVQLYEIYLDSPLAGTTTYQRIWQGITMSNCIKYPDFPDFVDWNVRLLSATNYNWGLSVFHLPEYDINVNPTWKNYSSNAGTKMYTFSMP